VTSAWSVSAHRLYQCPRAWWLTHRAHVEQQQDAVNNRGVMCHAGLAAGYAFLDQHGRDPRKMTPGAVRRGLFEAVSDAVTEVAQGAHANSWDADEAFEAVIGALRHLGPQARDVVLGVELPMLITVDGVEITCRADVVYRRDGVTVVRDWKSSSELPRAFELPGDRQLAVGALCAARTFDTTRVAVEIASINARVAVTSVIATARALAGARAVAASAWAAQFDQGFLPRPGERCASCKVRASCPVFAPNGRVIPTPGPDGRSVATGVILL
jgi:hypothetical protein